MKIHEDIINAIRYEISYLLNDTAVWASIFFFLPSDPSRPLRGNQLKSGKTESRSNRRDGAGLIRRRPIKPANTEELIRSRFTTEWYQLTGSPAN